MIAVGPLLVHAVPALLLASAGVAIAAAIWPVMPTWLVVVPALAAVGAWLGGRSWRRPEPAVVGATIAGGRLELVLEAVDDGVWDWDASTGRVFFSARWKAMLGHAEDEIGDRLEEWSERIHPDDRERVLAELGRHMDGATSSYSSEHRLRCKDGSWKWVLDRGRIVTRDAAGRPLRAVGTHSDVSARRQAEAALAATQALARQLIEASPLGIAVYDGGSGRCLQANTACARLLRVDPDQLLGEDFRRIPWWEERGLLSAAEATLGDGAARSCELEIPDGSGHGIWLGCHLSRIDGGRLLLMHQDITVRRRLEAERTLLQEDLERRVAERTAALALANAELIGQGRSLRIFKNVIEQNPVAILITDQDMGITYSNPAFTALSGYSPGEALGREPGYFSAHAGGTLSGQRRTVAEGRTWSGELACRRKDGGEYWVEALVAPMTGTGGVTTGYLCFHRDITAIKQAQAEARQRADELIQSDKMAALGTLVAGVGHEINNPANFISLNAPMLREFWSAAEPALDAAAVQDPELRLCNLPWARVRVLVPRLFTGIEEGIDRIRRIVGDLRDFARPDTSGSQRVDLNRVVKAGTAITSHAIGKATAAFTCRLDPDLPAVAGSFQKLEQVVVNLVLNACQALPDPARAVDVSTAYDPVLHRVVLTVEDQGVGIPADHLAHLGEPFFTTKRDRGGTGLGLSVTRRIVEDHGGEIHFHSHAGRGTRVTVLLPAAAPAQP